MSYTKYKTSKLKYLVHVGILFLILGLCLLFLWPQIMNYIVDSKLSLKPDSNIFKIWQKTIKPSYLDIYVHNWTNPYDGNNDTIKPKFEEVGPFRFMEFKEKVNITWNENNTISYRQIKRWKFVREGSCCSLSTKLTTINAIMVAVSHKARSYSPPIKMLASSTLGAISPDIFVTKNASELLFTGYQDPILGIMKSFPMLSSLPPIERFGWFFGKNGSSNPDGLINMDVSNQYKGLIRRWNTFDKTPFNEGYCGRIHGSAGELYPPGQTRDQISFFSTDMCRNIPLDYEKDVSLHGLPGFKYVATDAMLDNGTLYPENKCYCNGECIPSGALNISACRFGSPIFISLPHFHNADPFHLNNVEGLQPVKDKHEFSMVLEPNTGLPLQAAIRIQMNMYLRPVKYMSIINDVPTLLFPILWFQVQTTASEDFVSSLKFLFNLPIILKATALTLIVISIIMIIVALFNPIVTTVRKRKYDNKADFMMNGEDVPLRESK